MTADGHEGLAATKLRPPEPPARLVDRVRLAEILDAGLDRQVPLLLVSAPAGSGKSTLVASWTASRPEATAWLQVEQRDSDPARFWSYLAEAIGRAHPIATDVVTSVVVGSNGDDEAVVSVLVNELMTVREPLLVVIDDYHLIDDPGVHRGMERLVDLAPHQVSIVVCTRIDPPFRLGRLRVRDQLAEVRADDLRFEPAEASGLLSGAGASLRPDLVDQLCERTEGWAAGLVLAGISLGRAPSPDEFIEAFRGDDQLVVEYLRDELLATLDAGSRRRLLETSILDQLCGDLVDAVTGATDGTAWLATTARANQLVIGLDRTGTWFRYHHLLRDLLRLEARQALAPQQPELHARAATWFESDGDLSEAMAHRLAGGDLDGAAQVLRALGPQLIADGRIETLRGFLDQLGDVARSVTWCALLAGWCDFIGGRYARAEEWLDAMTAAAPPDFDHAVALPLRINISLGRGDVTAALAAARPLADAGALESGRAELLTAIGAARAWAGQPDDARTALRAAVAKAGDHGLHTAHVLALVYLAVVELEDGTAATAREAASLALDTADGFGLSAYHGVAPAHAIGARTADDPDRARVIAGRALGLSRRASTDLALGYVLATCGDTLLDLGDPAGRALLHDARTVLDRCPDPGIAGRYLARAESRHGLGGPAEASAELVDQLTDRELAVLRYLPTTLSQRDIAAELYVSLNTVKTHCRAIYRKLGVGDRHAAVQAARDIQLL